MLHPKPQTPQTERKQNMNIETLNDMNQTDNQPYFKEGYVLQHTFQPLSDIPAAEQKARALYLEDGTEVFERIANDFADFFAQCADPSREIVAIKFGVPTSDDFSRPVHWFSDA